MGKSCGKENRFSGEEIEDVDEVVRKGWEGSVCGYHDMLDGHGCHDGFNVRDGVILGRGQGDEKEAGSVEE